jgi:hypothetical protein
MSTVMLKVLVLFLGSIWNFTQPKAGSSNTASSSRPTPRKKPLRAPRAAMQPAHPAFVEAFESPVVPVMFDALILMRVS